MIQVQNLSVRAGTFSLDGISFEVPAGAYAILMGRTGTGKTTLLESICGLRTVTAGSLHLLGRDVTRLKPSQRGVGFVPQEGALFPTLRVRDQLGFALTIRKWSRARIEARIQELAELLSIEHLLHRFVQGLSGGERQRVALGRALAAQPGVLCLDEPLSALDEATREGMYGLLRSIRERTQVTTLHITHSRAEAARLGDLVFRLHEGRIQPVPRDELCNETHPTADDEESGSNGPHPS